MFVWCEVELVFWFLVFLLLLRLLKLLGLFRLLVFFRVLRLLMLQCNIVRRGFRVVLLLVRSLGLLTYFMAIRPILSTT